MTKTTRLSLVTVLWFSAAVSLPAHDILHATIAMTPGKPHVEAPSQIEVTLTTSAGVPPHLVGGRLWVSGAMPGHAMPPLEAPLRATTKPGVFVGELAFSMSGPWFVSLNLTEDNGESMIATFEMVVARYDDPETTETGVHKVDMLLTEGRNMVPPMWVLLGAIALILVAEGTALTYHYFSERVEEV